MDWRKWRGGYSVTGKMGYRGTEEVDRDSEQRGRQEEADSEEAEKRAVKGAYSRDARANEKEDGQT
jgi:hypothetical protein